jgi:7-cyano-7-deazaguanine synthase in queuosine biosynthesis
MSFLVEKLVGEVEWTLSEGPFEEKWRAREAARTSGTPASPARVIDLSIDDGKVLCMYGRIEPPFPPRWKEYKVTNSRRGDESIMTTVDSSQNQAPAPESDKAVAPSVPSVETAATVGTAQPAAPAPVPAPVVVPAPEVPPAVEGLLSGTDDEDASSETSIPVVSATGPKTVALLFTGGTCSTSTLINLLSRGFEVTPYYMEDPEFEGTERELGIARSVLRIARASTKLVHDLEVLSVKIPKKQEERRRRYYVELLTKELTGAGFNAIAYGAQPLEATEEDEFEPDDPNFVSEAMAEDTDTSSLQECTPLEVISPDTLDIGGLAQQLSPFVTSTVAKDMLFASSSCAEPGESKRECGDCRTCKQRYRLFTRLFGKDGSKYLKGSWCRTTTATLKQKAEEKGSPLTPDEVTAIIAPKKKKKADKSAT